VWCSAKSLLLQLATAACLSNLYSGGLFSSAFFCVNLVSPLFTSDVEVVHRVRHCVQIMFPLLLTARHCVFSYVNCALLLFSLCCGCVCRLHLFTCTHTHTHKHHRRQPFLSPVFFVCFQFLIVLSCFLLLVSPLIEFVVLPRLFSFSFLCVCLSLSLSCLMYCKVDVGLKPACEAKHGILFSHYCPPLCLSVCAMTYPLLYLRGRVHVILFK
jgi:hypothetical protein